MKRWFFTILLFLLLVSGGAIVNVAVAWACAIYGGTYDSDARYVIRQKDIAWWREHAPASWPSTPRDGARFSGFGTVSIMLTEYAESDGMGTLGNNGTKKSAGLPLGSMVGYGLVDRTTRRAWTVGEVWIPQTWWHPPGRLPLYPIWSGFAINTLFYAVLLWLAFIGVRYGRRCLRLKRGRCPKCGYDLRGAPSGGGAGGGCPECGWNRQPEATA
jgi:hypothetical protein